MLAFVVLMASIIVAFFSRAMAEQQISRASANQTKVKLFADGAVDTILGDLKAEVAAGASATNTYPNGHIVYEVTNSTKLVPARTYAGATNSDYINLISYSGTPLYTGGPDRADGDKTTVTNASGRNFTVDRWNKPRFFPQSGSARNIFDQIDGRLLKRMIPMPPHPIPIQ